MPEKAFQLRCGGAPAVDLHPDVEFVEVDDSVDGSFFTVRLRLTAGPDGEWSHLSDERLTPFAPFGVDLGFTGGGGPAGAVGGLLGGGARGRSRWPRATWSAPPCG
ncbi:hypothetical protein ACFQ0M_10275 [Kitasatospora aburaviensis]